LGFFNKDFSKRSVYDPRTSASKKLLFRQFLRAEVQNFPDVARVEFYEETNLLGSDETLPYDLVVDNDEFGSYSNTYTAKAVNTAGETLSSNALVITTNVLGELVLSPDDSIMVAGGPATLFEAYLQTEDAGGRVSVTWMLEGPGTLSVSEGEQTEYTPPATLEAETTATVTATLPDGRSGRIFLTLRPSTPGESIYFVNADVRPGVAYITVLENSSGAAFPSAIVSVNGTTIPFSGGRFQGFLSTIGAGETVDLEITVPEGTIRGSVMMPFAPDLIAPTDGSSVSAANPLNIAWDITESPMNFRLGYGTDPYENDLAVSTNSTGSSRSYSFTGIPANKTLNIYVIAQNKTMELTGPMTPDSGLYTQNSDGSSNATITTTP
jgi:hypothetical protein